MKKPAPVSLAKALRISKRAPSVDDLVDQARKQQDEASEVLESLARKLA